MTEETYKSGWNAFVAAHASEDSNEMLARRWAILGDDEKTKYADARRTVSSLDIDKGLGVVMHVVRELRVTQEWIGCSNMLCVRCFMRSQEGGVRMCVWGRLRFP